MMYISNIMHSPILDVSCVSFPIVENWSCESRQMPFWRFYWNANEYGLIRHAGKITRLKPDRIYIIPAHTDYASWCEKPIVHFYIHFTLVRDYTPGIYSLPADRSSIVETQSIMEQQGRTDLTLLSFNMRVYELLLRHLCLLDPAGFSQETLDPGIVNVLRYIETHLNETLTNDTLARIAHMHTNAFIRKFKSSCRHSPQQFVTLRRCERIAQRLEENRLTLDELAERFGFCDRYHLSRVFKQYRGFSPAAYRKRFRPRVADES